MRQIDSKYHTENDEIINTLTGEKIPLDEPLFLFRAKDNLSVKVLQYYQFLAWQLDFNINLNTKFIEQINANVNKFWNWMLTHKTKDPD